MTNNPRFEIALCAVCGAQYRRNVNVGHPRRYCSTACRVEANSEGKGEPSASNWDGETRYSERPLTVPYTRHCFMCGRDQGAMEWLTQDDVAALKKQRLAPCGECGGWCYWEPQDMGLMTSQLAADRDRAA